jgi:hypothetical protein
MANSERKQAFIETHLSLLFVQCQTTLQRRRTQHSLTISYRWPKIHKNHENCGYVGRVGSVLTFALGGNESLGGPCTTSPKAMISRSGTGS